MQMELQLLMHGVAGSNPAAITQVMA